MGRGRLALGLLVVMIRAAAAQAVAARPSSVPSPARFLERLHSDVVAQEGAGEVHRSIDRFAIYSIARSHDTVVVTADTVSLTASLDNVPQGVDVDAMIGGRWFLLADPGEVHVVDRPFVPARVADISDIGRAMDDFFFPAPPPLAVGARVADSAHRVWQRLADSAGNQRYRINAPVHTDSSYRATDSVAVHSRTDASEQSDLIWNALRGPVGWTRRISTNATSQFVGRTLRATVDQRITVRRIP